MEWDEEGKPKNKADYNKRKQYKLDGVKFTSSYQAELDLCNAARRPVYAIRGKPVTPDQVREIILATDNNIINSRKIYFEYFESEWVKSNIFSNMQRVHSTSDRISYGWCHPDGYIGLNHYMYSKNPFYYKLVGPWIYVAK